MEKSTSNDIFNLIEQWQISGKIKIINIVP